MLQFGDFSVTLVLLTLWLNPCVVHVAGADGTTPTNNRKEQRQICRGSSFGLRTSADSDDWYKLYRTKYTNCTYVDGNLELVSLDKNYDLSFLKDIKEVTGYVLIFSVQSDSLSLTNLQIIRGQMLFENKGRNYSLFVAHNGLKELQLVSLHEILAGDVLFHNNSWLCYENTINWRDILPEKSIVVNNDTSVKLRSCEPCDVKCTFQNSRSCWGSGPDMCQNMTRLSCSQQCDGRCFGTQPSECCHKECAGGCIGPLNTNCWACKNFENDGRCEQHCPTEFIYSKEHFKNIPNPDFKYSHGSICRDKCPNYLIMDKGACVRECDAGHVRSLDKKCVSCEEKHITCPKQCSGIKPPDFLHAGNIANFTGCNIIQGSISIRETSFTGDQHRHLAGISENDLSVFETVEEITGYLLINADSITRLDYFRNLHTIRGSETIEGTPLSLKIYDTKVRSLDFQSLKEIQYGNIAIVNNTLLCYVNSINWQELFSTSDQMSFITNQKESICVENNATCSAECSSSGCWGPRDDQCLSCKNFSFGKQCLPSCLAVPGVYQSSPTICERCHPECKTRCADNSSRTCDGCRNVRDGPFCVAECAENKYHDEFNVCQPCHANCDGGCTGIGNYVGPGGCNSCAIVILDSQDNVTSCISADSSCGDGYYKKMLQGHRIEKLNGRQACRKCHPECLICDENSLSLSSCKSCLHFQQDDRCVRNCSSDYYLKNQTNICLRCDSRCLQCVGPTAGHCTVCKQYMVYHDINDKTKGFNCTETCPDHAPHKIIEESIEGEKVTVCVKEDDKFNPETIGKIVGSVIGGVIFLSIVIVVIVVASYRRAQAEANKVKLTAQLFGVSELEPLSPSGVGPDMANLRLIKESELRRGGIIGSGTYTNVYKGLWIPENENVKLIVAIKVLNEGTSPSQSKELLEEARVMASVNDQYCIRILAFCMTAQMMIITQLMPHGCLLEYVRRNKKNIGSKVLLNWCTQIAKGMAYLEQRSIVHRDLAARNILVQHPEHLRITDFGLSKLLDCNENVVRYSGEKFPVRWMALESIQNRTFTHKSDVWSYGVTLWELFTYGTIPYESIQSNMIPDLLEKGERLSQPPMCTIDVYMLMIKCWVIDAISRPNFKFLAEEFAKMARDPGRYLVIDGDEFMRISSQNIDMKELMRYLSVDSEGAELIVTADDYLRPRGRMRTTSAQSHTERLGSVEETALDDVDGLSNNSAARQITPADQRSAAGQRLRQNSRSRDPSNTITRQQSAAVSPTGPRQNSRYCSDPCKTALQQQLMLQNSQNQGSNEDADVFDGSAALVDNPLNSLRGQKRNNFDYLQPTGDNRHVDKFNSFDRRPENRRSNPPPPTQFISNPEYFDDLFDKPTEQDPFLPGSQQWTGSQNSVKYYNELEEKPPLLHTSSAVQQFGNDT